MEITSKINAKVKRKTVGWDYVKNNTGIYQPVTKVDTRLVTIDHEWRGLDKVVIFIEGNRMEPAYEPAWVYDKFYRVDEQIEVIFSKK